MVEALGGREQFAQLVDLTLAVPCQIGRALARTRGRIEIGRGRAHRLRRGQQRPLARLADDDVRGGEVAQHQCPGERARGRGRGRRPEILARLHVKDEVGDIAGGEDQVGAEGRALARDVDAEAGQTQPAREPALLIIFAVIGQEDLGDDAEDAAPRDRERAIIDAPVAPQRRADQQHRLELRAGLHDRRDPRLSRIEQRVLQMQIVDGVAGDIELGKDQQVRAGFVAGFGQLDRRAPIGGRIARGRDGGADARADHPLAVERIKGVSLRHHSASSIICRPTRRHAIRTGPRPISPKWATRCAVSRPSRAQAK